MHADACTHTDACTYTQTHTHTHAHTRTHTHSTDTHTNAHTHMHVHTHTQNKYYRFLTFARLYQDQFSTPYNPNVSIRSVVSINSLVFYLSNIFLPINHPSEHCMHTTIEQNN